MDGARLVTSFVFQSYAQNRGNNEFPSHQANKVSAFHTVPLLISSVLETCPNFLLNKTVSRPSSLAYAMGNMTWIIINLRRKQQSRALIDTLVLCCSYCWVVFFFFFAYIPFNLDGWSPWMWFHSTLTKCQKVQAYSCCFKSMTGDFTQDVATYKILGVGCGHSMSCLNYRILNSGYTYRMFQVPKR